MENQSLTYTLYKPNSKISGSAMSLQLSKDRDCVYLNMIQQSSWNDETKKGGFKENQGNDQKSLSSKLNMDELGGMLATLKNPAAPWSAFHNFNDNKTQLSLKVWDRSSMSKPNAMSFGVTKNGSLKIGTYFEPGEVECLKVFLMEAIKEIMWNKNKSKVIEDQKGE